MVPEIFLANLLASKKPFDIYSGFDLDGDDLDVGRESFDEFLGRSDERRLTAEFDKTKVFKNSKNSLNFIKQFDEFSIFVVFSTIF